MSDNEDYTDTELAIQGLNNIVSMIGDISSNVRNIRYTQQLILLLIMDILTFKN